MNDMEFSRADVTADTDLNITPRSLMIKISRTADITMAEPLKTVLKFWIAEILVK